MLGVIGNVLGAIAGGGITGLLGAGLNAFVEHKKQKQQFEHEKAMAVIERDTMKMEHEARIKVVETEYEGKKDVAESEAFGKSFEMDRATYIRGIPESKFTVVLFTIVDFVRGMTRPTLTAYLCALTTWLAYQVYNLVGGMEALTQDQCYTLLSQVIYVILYLTITAVCWWFGTRGKSPKKTLR